MRGYLFSLEVLIAVIILMFPVLTITLNTMEFDNKNEKIYNALELLEKENKLDEIENSLDVDFNLSVSPECNGNEMYYLVVSGTNKFKVIKICY